MKGVLNDHGPESRWWSIRLASQRGLTAVFLALVSAGREGQMATGCEPSYGTTRDLGLVLADAGSFSGFPAFEFIELKRRYIRPDPWIRGNRRLTQMAFVNPSGEDFVSYWDEYKVHSR